MAAASKWAVPEFSTTEVDRAGHLLAHNGAANVLAAGRALDVINNWRSAHAFPLHILQTALRENAVEADGTAITAQRLKRMPSIERKLRRNKNMRLSQMQDVGGARAILGNVNQVRELHARYRNSRARHELAGEKDYLANPKSSGYRGVHLMYRYRNANDAYNGLRIELQLRTRRQHAWATAVETVGLFLKQSLKASEGDEKWLRFFELIGALFAHGEGLPLGENVPQEHAVLLRQTLESARELDVRRKLRDFQSALRLGKSKHAQHAKYFLLLSEQDDKLYVKPYSGRSLAQANEDYLREEKRLAGTAGEVVLVAADSLQRAFPNYYRDTETFLREMNRVLGRR